MSDRPDRPSEKSPSRPEERAPDRAIVADIGGTNSRFALSEGGRLVPGSARRYHNADHEGLEAVLRRFMADVGCLDPVAACCALAGPVHAGKGELTNVDWAIDTAILAEATGAKTVALLNDLQAQGHAIGHLPQDSLQVILAGPPPNLNAAQLVVGLGTGFNIAPIFNTESGRFVPPSEAGHAALPARRAEDLALADWITERHGFCSIEDGLSGRGLAWIHGFLAERDGAPETIGSREVMARLEGAGPGAERARAAVATFVRLAGEVCGDLALTLLPFGGLFLIGGMARAVAPYMDAGGFAEAFRDKGRFSGFMGQFAVTLVTDDDAALIGCARHLHGLRGPAPAG